MGGLQAAGLQRLIPGLDRRRWLLVTTVVAGLGWAAASAPSALSGGGGDASAPALLVIFFGAVGLGGLLGALLGAAQAMVLRGRVRHPWRWVGADALAWAPAMAVIFLGATAPGAGWPVLAVAALGAVTGLGAGTLLGLVTGWFLATLDGAPAHNRVVLALLGSPAHRVLDRSLVAVRLRGAVTGRVIELPAEYAPDDGGVVLVPGRPERKRWWRNLIETAPVDVLLHGRWQHGEGRVLRPGDVGYRGSVAAFRRRWPHARLAADNLVVRIRLSGR